MGTAANSVEVIAPPPGGLSLRRNFAWTLAGNAFYGACQWGMLVALAKLGSPVMVGQFALGLAIGAPVMLLSNLQLRAVLATDVRNEYRFRHYLELRLVSTVLAFFAIGAIALAGGYRWETALVVIVVGAAKSVESVSDIFYGLFQKHERLDRIAIAMMLRGLGSVAGFVIALWITKRLEWALLALVGWWTVVLLGYESRTGVAMLQKSDKGGGGPSTFWDWPRLWRLARLSLPLGIATVLVSLNTNIPRYFVGHYLGEAALGYFAALAYVMVAGYTVMAALGQSASPRLARYYQTDLKGFKRVLGRMLLVAVVAGMAGIVVVVFMGRQVLAILYRPDYAQYQNLFVLLMVGAGLSYICSMLGFAITSTRKYTAYILPTALVTIGTAVACWVFIPVWGMNGAGLATCTTALTLMVALVIILRKIWRSRIESPQ